MQGNGRIISAIIFGLVLLAFARHTNAQADDMCREYGETPSREAGRDNRLVPFVFGRIVVRSVRQDAKPPRVVAIYSDSLQPATRQVVGRSGNYCFQKRGSGGTLVIEIDGVEAARKSVFDVSNTRQREDFDVYPPGTNEPTQPGVINAKFARPPNEMTADLYKKAAAAEQDNQSAKAIGLVKEIVAIDPEDFVAWAKLGTLHLANNAVPEARTALERSLALRKDYTPALLNLGIINAVDGSVAAAIELFERAVIADPLSAKTYRLLGEAYLQARRGNDGLAALDEALRLDPIGMAECHLLKARLYDLAGAKNLATKEYKAFLAKVASHPDKKKFEKYIKDNPE